MNIQEVKTTLENHGWKPWGLGKRGYQCYRRGNRYAWVGSRFIEQSGDPIAFDFVAANRQDLLRWLPPSKKRFHWKGHFVPAIIAEKEKALPEIGSGL